MAPAVRRVHEWVVAEAERRGELLAGVRVYGELVGGAYPHDEAPPPPDGVKAVHQEWRDTVMMGPRQTVDVAFVADSVGEWMYHCHILDHAAGGMMGTIAVE